MAEYPALDLSFPHTAQTPALLELVSAALDDFDPTAITEEETGGAWRVFFRTASSRDAALAILRAQFGDRLTSVSSVDVPDDGWARRSQARLTAIRVGRIVVAPPWSPEAMRGAAGSGDLVIVIDPSMGFGTGHHATTRLCLALLQRQPVEGTRVTDVGTGSGVLALAAWRLGAAAVTAVDVDPDALQNAGDNVRLNGAAEAVTLVEADLSSLDLPPADIVLANLTASVLQRHAPELVRLAGPGGRLIVSGFGPDERSAVEQAFGLAAVDAGREDAWSAIVLITRPPTRT